MTKASLLNLALRNIGVITIGQTASTTATNAATDVYESIYDWLSEQGLVSWGVDDALPGWAVMPVKRIISPDLAREFHLSENRISFFQAEAKLGFDDLLKAFSQDYSEEAHEAEYF